MPHNPQSAPSEQFRLPDYRILSLSGRDATGFAHAQFMNDVVGLPVGHWQWNGWLTPKGRLVALFALLKREEQLLWLLLPDVDPMELTTALQRFVFRSKVAMEIPDLIATGGFAPPGEASLAQFSAGGAGVELDMGGEGGPRCLRIGANVSGSGDGAKRWATFDIEHGLPRLPASQAAQWTPQQLSLDRLRAYSVKKGCYPGQEIVARTHFLGQAKRGLALFESSGPVNVGSDILVGDQVLGTIVSAGGNRALGVLPLEHVAAGLHAGGLMLRELPLLGGLAR